METYKYKNSLNNIFRAAKFEPIFNANNLLVAEIYHSEGYINTGCYVDRPTFRLLMTPAGHQQFMT
jgi:hypothetical protein